MAEQAVISEIVHNGKQGRNAQSRMSNTVHTQNGSSVESVSQSDISGEQATRKASGYLGKHVSMFFGAEEPVFLPLEQPIWQVTVFFLRYQIGPVKLAFLDVDARTGEVVSLTEDEIQKLRKRADAVVKNYTLSTASRS